MTRERMTGVRAAGDASADQVFALFRVAAGPRLGHGHLRRAEALAQALGRPACISVRGAGGAATRLPALEARGPLHAIDAVRPAVLVIDEPVAAQGEPWCRAAQRRGVPVVSLHDLGLARLPSTLAVDGSVASPSRGWPSAAVLRGLRHAVIRRPRRNRRPFPVRRVLISLGGGPRRVLVAALVSALARCWPSLEILTTQAVPEAAAHANLRTVAAPAGLGEWFPRVDVAILAGGLSLYEAIAAGVPSIAVAVVPAQRPTIRGFAAQGLAIDGGTAYLAPSRSITRRVTDRLAHVLGDTAWRRRVRREGPRLIDGRGAARVAHAIVALTREADRG